MKFKKWFVREFGVNLRTVHIHDDRIAVVGDSGPGYSTLRRRWIAVLRELYRENRELRRQLRRHREE